MYYFLTFAINVAVMEPAARRDCHAYGAMA
jgi:hypothetical protein